MTGEDKRILRVFPRRTKATPTDDLAVVGEPGLFLPEVDEVHISVTFTWDLARGQRLLQAWKHHYPGRVRIGGPAITDSPWAERCGPFVPGMYLRPDYVITSRGCPNRCPWCLVPEQEGRLREFGEIPGGHIVQDNNLLACSDRHVFAVFAMLRSQRKAAVFSGGIEAARVTSAVVEELRSLRIKQLFLAYDHVSHWAEIERAISLLRRGGLTLRQVRCFVLAGFDDQDTPETAEGRCQQVLEAGGLPFMMLYRPPDDRVLYGPDWRAAQRKWTRPAAMLATSARPTRERLL